MEGRQDHVSPPWQPTPRRVPPGENEGGLAGVLVEELRGRSAGAATGVLPNARGAVERAIRRQAVALRAEARWDPNARLRDHRRNPLAVANRARPVRPVPRAG